MLPARETQLPEPACELHGEGTASDYAYQLLTSLGIGVRRQPGPPDEHPAMTWARSGLMTLTGRPDGEPRMCPVPIASCADGALKALARLAPAGAFDGLRGAQLLSERAAIAGFTRAGSISPGGSCRLLEAADGWLAVNLAREDDWALAPAWLEEPGVTDWEGVRHAVRGRPVQELVERGRLMGLAVAIDKPIAAAYPALHSSMRGNDRKKTQPLVVDLSSLWAGPLCSHLLQRAGARVIKVESPLRPDGARNGPPRFFDLLNAGKLSVAIDPTAAQGREQLRALLRAADIVIEGSRPRALRQLGIRSEELVTENPRLTWISISGYGRGVPQENWVAYGDDAGVAAGLSRLLFEATGEHMLCGDAIADPLTGLHAALAAWAGFLRGGAGLVPVALRDVVSHCLQFDLPDTAEALRARQRAWTVLAREHVSTPRARMPRAPAPTLGADTDAILAELS